MRGDSYDSDDAPSAAGTYTVTATFAGNDTYSSGTDNEALTIGKAAVTVTATGGSFTYDGLPKAGSGTATGVNSENLAPVAIHYTGTTNAGDSYDSDDAPSAAGTYTVTATFAGNDTYSSGTDNEALTIGKAAVTVTATGGSFTYDGLPKAGSGTATGVNSENLAPVAIHYTGTTNAGDSYDSDDAPSAAGTYTVTATFAGNDTYSSGTDNEVLTIGKAAVTVTATGGSFTYDGLPKAGSGTATGVNSENLAPVAIHYTGTTNAGDSYDSDDAPSAAGTYTVTATFAGNDTYSSGTDNEVLTIGKAAVTVTATGGSFTYDGLPKAGSGTATGVNSENLAPVAIHYTGTTNAGDSYDSDDAPSAAGTYTVTATFAGNDTYSSGTDNETLTIGKAAVTVTATGGSFTYDGLPKAGSGTATGVNSENLAPVAIHYTGTTNAGDSYDSDDAPSAAGTYTVTATFAGNDTYSSGTDNEVLTIGKAAVTVTATGGSFTYDGLPKAGSGTATGVNSENLAPVAIHYTGTTNAG
ncbi:MAG: MBG domain-containing protein [Bacteroidota bacterium]